MRPKHLSLMALLLATLGLVACGGSDSDDPEPNDPPPEEPSENDADGDGVADEDDNCPDEANADQVDSDANGEGDACDPIPTEYVFENADGESTVSYTGQTKRHILIQDLVLEMNGLSEDADANVVDDLNFYFRYDASTSDDLPVQFSLEGEALAPNPTGDEFTYGDIADGKDLVGKIAGGDGEGGGETGTLINDEFFGWEDGLDDSPLPVELVDYLFEQLANEATDNATPQIATESGDVPLDTVTVDAQARDYRQLIQKFLLSAVTFSQGTNDYMQKDFAGLLEIEGDATFTVGEHEWDEAFGYFGAARDYADYTDDEIRAGGDDRRPEYANGYYDSNGDGMIDVRSEINLGNSVNCAKRDAGSAGNANPTDFTQQAFDAFLLGRKVLRNAAAEGELTADAEAVLDEQVTIGARTWEKCVAATVVHYINDTRAEMDKFDTEADTFADLNNFRTLAKTWSEMKGFALGLQFSPESPFRADEESLDDLRTVLSLMGDAPVLADGTQAGEAYDGGVAQYADDLEQARDLLQQAYGFDAENVQNW